MRRFGVVSLVFGLVVALGGIALAGPGDVATVVGTGTGSSTGDGGLATAATIKFPTAVAVDGSGNLYVAEYHGCLVRRVDAQTGIITTVAGTTCGFSGDGGPATSAQVQVLCDIDLDDDGNLYIADCFNNRIRMVDALTGDIDTIAGTGVGGFSGDGGAADAAQLNDPEGIAVDASGNLYIADTGNHRIRKVDALTGDIDTIAGTGTAGFSGDGAAATSAKINNPRAVAVDGSGNVFIGDSINYRVRMVDTDGDISTVAGTGTSGYNGDGIAATAATLSDLYGVEIHPDGSILIGDTNNQRVRRFTVGGVITTIAGNGTLGFSGDGGPATSAQFQFPGKPAVAVDHTVYIPDTNSHRVRAIAPPDADGDGFSDAIDLFPSIYSKCRTSQATIIGTSGNDNPLNGTAGNDVIMGFGGADVIYGFGGDDLVCAGNGADIVYGGDGKDRIFGENGPDTLYGNEKSDRLYGGNNDDILRGGDGTRDRLFGGPGTYDDLDGGSGTDDHCTSEGAAGFYRCEVIF